MRRVVIGRSFGRFTEPRGARARRGPVAVLALTALFLLAGLIHDGGSADASQSAGSATGLMSLHFVVDRRSLPPLPYGDITLKVDALGALAASVSADGHAIPSSLQADHVVFTTAGRDVVVTLQSPTRTAGAGAFERAPLKYDRKWAWSHGFDDNTDLQGGIEAFRARNWRATLFMICSQISDTRQEEDWILDAPGLKRLLGEGWSVGNHSWDHGGAANASAARESVIRCSNRLADIVADSPWPGYRVIAFAAPNFDEGYAPIIRSLRDSGTTHLLYDESGNDFVIRVDPGATTAPAGAVPFDRDLVIGRYTPIGWDAAAARAAIDSVAAQASASTHLWFNSLAHGSNEDSLEPVLDHVYRTYGPGGTNEVLVAPSAEIYSYLMVRDGALIEYDGSAVAVAVEDSASNNNGILEPGEAAGIQPAWRLGFDALGVAGLSVAGPDYTLSDNDATYGNLTAGVTVSCATSLNCYEVVVDGARTSTHWDLSLEETLSTGVTHDWALHVGASFDDVPPTDPFYPFIETLLHNEVTSGCSVDRYCSTVITTRAQMSVFVLKAREGSAYVPPACVAGAAAFSDVPAADPFCPYVEELSRRGVVAGCGVGVFCPNNPVTREQMAVFTLKTLEGRGYSPVACVAGSEAFADVPATSPFCRWVEEYQRRGITAGCTATRYCPTNRVTRGQMAVFQTKTFDLQM